MPAPLVQKAIAVACTYCGAPVGKACTDLSGRRYPYVHAIRYRAWKNKADTDTR